ncbi:MAG TPA: hypothetical protein VN316_01010 [candidate division Zixibacteria bacterium]|nr:hypothetical protein [candidate division Zixibacteria bacterium]
MSWKGIMDSSRSGLRKTRLWRSQMIKVIKLEANNINWMISVLFMITDSALPGVPALF